MRIPKGDHICTPPHTATLRAATLLYQMLHCSDVVVDFGKSISDFLNHCSAAIVSWGLIGNRHETTTPAMRLSVHELMLVLVLVPIVVLVLVPVLEVIPMQRSAQCSSCMRNRNQLECTVTCRDRCSHVSPSASVAVQGI